MKKIVQITIFLVAVGLMYSEVIAKMVTQWTEDPNYSHGFLVPIISGYLLWQRREELAKTRAETSNLGILITILGLGIYTFGHLAAELFTMRVSMLIVVAGGIITYYGRGVFNKVLFAYCYLYLMIPLPYIIYDLIAFPLKLFVAKYSVMALQIMAVTVYRDGNMIYLPNTVLEVADACSGMRSLVSLIALSVAYGYLYFKRTIPRIVLMVSAIPIAVLANGFRVLMTGLLAQHYGAEVAEGFFHEFAGVAIFGASLMLLIGEALLIKKAIGCLSA